MSKQHCFLSEIKEKEQLSKSLHPDLFERNELLQKSNILLQNFLEKLDEEQAFSQNEPSTNQFKIRENPVEVDQSLLTIKKEVLHNGIRAASGGHLGYIPGGGLFASAVADYIAAVSNAYSGMYYACPGAVEMELACLDWMKGIFGFPESAVGNLTSGGSIANLIALTAARDAHEIKNEKIPKAVIYMGKQTHHCVHKAIRIIGLGDVKIHDIPLDENGKIIPSALGKQIQEDKTTGLIPFLVIASAGTTDVGAVDPLLEIAAIAQKENLWYHVDAAYGGFFILSEEKRHLFQGIEKADSLVIDPHKGLFLPYGLGAVLVKDKNAVFHSHHYTANYMQDAIDESQPINPADLSPELTKHFRALRMWLPLQLYGTKPFIACLEEKVLLCQYFRVKLKERGFELGPTPDLSVSYFWYPSKNENEFNKELLRLIHEDGSVFLSSTDLNGKFVIRMAILSFRTNIEIVDKAIAMIDKCLSLLFKK